MSLVFFINEFDIMEGVNERPGPNMSALAETGLPVLGCMKSPLWSTYMRGPSVISYLGTTPPCPVQETDGLVHFVLICQREDQHLHATKTPICMCAYVSSIIYRKFYRKARGWAVENGGDSAITDEAFKIGAWWNIH
jgi:hypothetical protein